MSDTFSSDKYKDLYGLLYNDFIVDLIKIDNDIMDKSNKIISAYITLIGNAEDIAGVHRWIDELSKDCNTIDKTSLTIEIRYKIQSLFCTKIADMMNQGYLVKTTIPHKVIEAVFLKVSANVYCNIIDQLASSNYNIEVDVDVDKNTDISDTQMNTDTNMQKSNMTSKNKYIILISISVILISILFLFALNGRYERVANGLVIDKWKKEVIQVGTDELPFKKNGEVVKQQ